MRTTAKHLDHIVNCINGQLQKLGKAGCYGLEYCYGHTNVVFYNDPNSTYTSDVRCGLSKSEAMDVLQGIYHALNTVIYGSALKTNP